MNQEIVELAKKFQDCKERHAEAEKKVKAINEEWLEVEKDLLTAMADEGVKSFDLEGVGKITMRISKIASVNAANKPDFFVYLRDTGNGGLIKEDVNSKTLTSFLRGHIEELQEAIVKDGMPAEHAKMLLDLDINHYNGVEIKPGAKFDAMDASVIVTQLMQGLGASVYEKRDIQLGKGK